HHKQKDTGNQNTLVEQNHKQKDTGNHEMLEVVSKHTGQSPIPFLPFRYQFLQLIKNFDFIFFIGLIFLNGITRSANNLYIAIYQTQVLKIKGMSNDEIKKIPTIFRPITTILGKNAVSTTTTCSTIVEIIFLFLSFNITKNFGLYWPLFFAQVAQTIRNFGYFLMPIGYKHSFLITCFLEAQKGVNFSLTHASGVQIVNNLTNENLKSTGQIIYAGAFFSLSSFISG
ncbi:Major Facilitator Superfamily (MFS), partial [Pseudoloma neurophilia]